MLNIENNNNKNNNLKNIFREIYLLKKFNIYFLNKWKNLIKKKFKKV